MEYYILLINLLIFVSSCVSTGNPHRDASAGCLAPAAVTDGSDRDSVILERFPVPQGCKRIVAAEGSFGSYLRNLPLKPEGQPVLYYDGRKKSNNGIYAAVIDLPVGCKDLHQCADAVIRLRAGYLYESGKFDSIHFNFTNGFRADYKNWMEGRRIVVQGNKASWKAGHKASNTREDFWQYLETVFMYAGTLSLSRELHPVTVDEMHIGDVFIRGGSPGHAVIVVDMAADTLTGRKLFMLAQSYMPAQEIQILQNPASPELSPWYSAGFTGLLFTPEWTFSRDELMRF